MLFSRTEFLVFAGVVFAFVVVVRNHRATKLWLLAASYCFYAYWDWRFTGLLLTLTLVNYGIGLALGATEPPARRKWLLAASLVVSLGLLGFFKYYGFFVASLSVLLEPLGLRLRTLEIILPVGISFYTFQTLSYTVDLYRRRLEPCRDLWDFALFVSFFPRLVAGPIVRAADFLPQLRTAARPSWPRAYDGFRQFTLGLFKKVFIADRIAPFADTVFGSPHAFNTGTTWLAVLAYAVQIYCDFSGYSDMAIGVARALGYDLKANFVHPYLAHRLDAFWRRWHISLSSWLRDYLYIPLGGNRRGTVRTHVNIMLTMLLGGLWHGAAWTFVLWGGLHGLGLVITRLLARGSKGDQPATGPLHAVGGWVLTFGFVCVMWTLFRAQSLEDALTLVHRMFVPHDGMAWVHSASVLAIVLMAANHVIHAWGPRWMVDLATGSPRMWLSPAYLFTLWWLVVVFYPTRFSPFIYFQF